RRPRSGCDTLPPCAGSKCPPRGGGIRASVEAQKRVHKRGTTRAHLLSRAIAAAVALGFAAGSAAAQTDYPQRAITLIVPFAAGGPTDVVSRIAADHMTRTLGQPVIIENVVGAGGTTASTRA